MASKAAAQAHVLRALSRWPKDALRTEVQFQDVLAKHWEKNASGPPAATLKQANALYSLLDNRYRNKYPINGSMLRPKSNPNYYEDLMKDLEEAPSRTWLQRRMLWLRGLIRLE